jgi:hypothetical protein
MYSPFVRIHSTRLHASAVTELAVPCSWTGGGLNPARWRVADGYASRQLRPRRKACLLTESARSRLLPDWP